MESRHESERPALDAPRGVTPAMLIDQIRITAPFLFTDRYAQLKPAHRYLEIIRKTAEAGAPENIPHEKYYELCVAAHHSTVATYVPTDVDNQIRYRLWNPQLPVETLRRMAELVIETGSW